MKRKSQKNKLNSMKPYFYIGVIVLVFAFITFSLVLYKPIVEVKKLEVTYTITDKAGFDLNSTVLSFGNLLPGSKGTRTVNLASEFTYPVYVTYTPDDSLKDILIFNDTVHKVDSMGNLSLSFTLLTPRDYPLGNYTGFIVVKIRK